MTKNKKAQKVIERLQEENQTYSVKILGDQENKDNAWAILMHCKDGFGSSENENYWGISNKTIKLFEEAEIKYEILK